VRLADGRQVQLDEGFRVIGREADDDAAGGKEDDGGGDDASSKRAFSTRAR
jgi:hypothetical protein